MAMFMLAHEIFDFETFDVEPGAVADRISTRETFINLNAVIQVTPMKTKSQGIGYTKLIFSGGVTVCISEENFLSQQSPGNNLG